MTAPMIWLVLYLSAGALILLACYNTPECLISSRLERNRQMTGAFSVGGNGPRKPAVAPEVPSTTG